MFPLRDDNPTRRRPVVTYALVLACVAVWIIVEGAGLVPAQLDASVCALGAIPAEILDAPIPVGGPCEAGGLAGAALISSMFLHGGWFHLIGNLWFLWIFGNNVEDAMGRLRFAVFYLVAGVAAALAHVWSDPTSVLPMVGASGAISGVMGAYLFLFPRARVKTLLVLVVFFTVVDLPAFVVLIYWFVIQLVSGAASAASGAVSGVAFWAHIGGFVAGLALVPLFRQRQSVDRWVSPAAGV
jgi:membrane associated rhomboid family serine protease